MQHWLVIIVLAILGWFGVQPVPEHQVIDQRQQVVAQTCDVIPLPRAHFAATQLTVVSWNAHKFQDPGWHDELAQLLHNRQLALFQEWQGWPSLPEPWQWQLAQAFSIHNQPAGVATAATKPLASCGLWHAEPWLGLPKTALISSVGWRDQVLLIVNIHGINFSWSMAPYVAQFDALASLMAQHSGPILVMGDMNTWRRARQQSLQHTFSPLGLHEVAFRPDHRSHFWGAVLDHVWVRGLTVEQAYTPQQSVSDHTPLFVNIRLP